MGRTIRGAWLTPRGGGEAEIRWGDVKFAAMIVGCTGCVGRKNKVVTFEPTGAREDEWGNGYVEIVGSAVFGAGENTVLSAPAGVEVILYESVDAIKERVYDIRRAEVGHNTGELAIISGGKYVGVVVEIVSNTEVANPKNDLLTTPVIDDFRCASSAEMEASRRELVRIPDETRLQLFGPTEAGRTRVDALREITADKRGALVTPLLLFPVEGIATPFTRITEALRITGGPTVRFVSAGVRGICV